MISGRATGEQPWLEDKQPGESAIGYFVRVDTATVYRVGKKAAGRMLDGRTWDEVPESVEPKPPRGGLPRWLVEDPLRRAEGSER